MVFLFLLKFFNSVVWLFLVLSWHLNCVTYVSSCVLCPLKIPPKPKPLDQFRIPSIQKIIDTSDTITRLCQNSSRLETLQASCLTDVSHLFCSLTQLIESLKKECPNGYNNIDQCSKCRRNNAVVYEKNLWIVTWIDSIGKMPSGISDGNYHWLGDYEQCQRLKKDQLFNGQYCLLEFQVPDTVLINVQCENNDPLSVRLGICLPAGCSIGETKELVKYVSNHEINVNCQPPHQWPIVAKLFLALIILWIIIVLVATIIRFFCIQKQKITSEDERITSPHFEIKLKNKRREPINETPFYHLHSFNLVNMNNTILNKFYACLSLQENARSSLRTRRNYSQNYHAVQGLQVILVCLVIFGNVFFLIMPYLENVSFFYYLFELWLVQPLVNSSFYMDGLIALGALKLTLKSQKTFKTIFGLLDNVKKQFARFWPTYLFITLIIIILYERLGDGPMWSQNDLVDRCASTWIFNLIYINNLIGYSATCLDGGFLLALEAQFYFFGFLLIYLTASKHITNFSLHCIVWSIIFISILYTFSIAFRYSTIETLIPTVSTPFLERGKTYKSFINKIYLNPLARIAPFLLGFIFPKELKKPSLLNKAIFQPFFWLFSFAIFIYVIWTPYLLLYFDMKKVANLTRLFSAIYCSTHRLCWAFFILYLAHFYNNSNPKNSINAILSWRIFYPLSKLVYVVFLISEPVALSLFASLHRPINATPFSTLLTSLGTIVCSFIIAFAIDIFYSRPITNFIALI